MTAIGVKAAEQILQEHFAPWVHALNMKVRLLTDATERQLVANVVGSYSIPPAS